MGYPQVDGRSALVQVEGQFGEHMVRQVDPGARENEADITWRFAGWWLLCERPKVAGSLWCQVWPQADEVPTLQNSHLRIATTRAS